MNALMLWPFVLLVPMLVAGYLRELIRPWLPD